MSTSTSRSAPPPPPEPGSRTPAPTGLAQPIFPSGSSSATRATAARAPQTVAAPKATAVRAVKNTRMAGIEQLTPPSADAPTVRLAPGMVIPGTRYRIVHWLGEGGMGVVYEAEHLDIERRVALKILRFDLSQQPEMAQVFRDEARAASRLGSPYIVEVYDFGELPDGRLFFCMELLQGSDLVPPTEQHTMDPAELIGLLRQVCKGLHTAHRADMVHRDVKPENIVRISRDGRSGTVKLVDFGVSAMLAAGNESNHVAGTPHYMAPEQALGQPFDGRLDVYALGCTAYELLVGRPPFDSESLPELLQMQIEQPPPPPSTVRHDIHIPPALEAVIMRCLAKQPEDRYADMADLEAALCEAQIASGLHTPWDDLPLPELEDTDRRERLLRDMPSPLADFGPPPRRWLWPAIAGTSTVAAAILAGLVLTRGPTDEQRAQVEALVTEARDAATRANWVAPGTPGAPTAYHKLLELEGMDGPAEDLAEEQGQTLRDDFSAALIEYGDRFWSTAETRPLARDFYKYALLFDSDDDRAFERSGLTHGMLAQFREDVESGNVRPVELMWGRLMAAAVADDEVQKLALEQQARAVSDQVELSMAGQEVMAKVAQATRVRVEPADRRGELDGAPDADLEQVLLEDEDQASESPEPAEVDAQEQERTTDESTDDAGRPASGKRKRRQRSRLHSAERDPSRSAELAKQGIAALRAGQRSEAESLFHQAISYDRRNGRALMGLSDVYFDLGANQKAVIYAERAIRTSPRTQSYRLKLGDAYFRVLRYRDALEQYREAKRLGEPRAASRIAKVRAKLGE